MLSNHWFKNVRGSTFQLNDDDIVVYLVGPSGSGKSLFVNEITSVSANVVGSSLKPFTVAPYAVRCELTKEEKNALGASTQRNIVFVDTPSFHTGVDDIAAEREMSNWLSKSKKTKSALVGVIYLHRLETDPASEPIQDHLDAFANTFPNGFGFLPERLHGVLRFDSDLRPQENKIKRHREAFQSQLATLHASRCQGGRLGWVPSLHPDVFEKGNRETAWQAVVGLFSGDQPTHPTSTTLMPGPRTTTLAQCTEQKEGISILPVLNEPSTPRR